MEFAALAGCNLATNLVVSISSIVLAAAGWSFLAPIVATLIGTIVLTVLLLMYRPALRILKPCLEGYREVFAFGAYSSAVVIVNVVYQWSPQLILGRILDFTAVGLYSRAISITQIFDKLVLQALTPVILPAISAHSRAGGDLKAAYLGAIELLSALQWPFLVFLAMMADAVILLWLGPTWIDVVPLVQVLCIASLSLFAACLTFPVLVAVGRVRDALASSLISLPPSLVITALASFWGVQAVANAALLALPLQAAVAIWFVGRHLAFGPTDLIRSTLKSGFVTVCCAAGIMLSMVITQFSGSGPTIALLLGGSLAFAGWWVGMTVTDHPLLKHLRVLVNRIAPAAPAKFRRVTESAFIESRFDAHKK
jgi:O-antigen/teichoic acid export membrane protein